MARSFNGSSSDQVTVGTGVPNHSGEFTASIWINISSYPGSRNIFYSRNNVAGQNAFFMIMNNTGKIDFEVGNGGTYTIINPGSSTTSTNTWAHMLLSVKNSTTTLTAYVNGVLDGTNSTGGIGSLSSTNTWMGYDTNNGLPFAGRLADAAQWSAALTLGEIQALASGMRPYNIRPASLIGYWPLDGVNSPEPDLSGFFNNGTLTGTINAAGPPLAYFTPRWPISIDIAAPPALQLMGQIWM